MLHQPSPPSSRVICLLYHRADISPPSQCPKDLLSSVVASLLSLPRIPLCLPYLYLYYLRQILTAPASHLEHYLHQVFMPPLSRLAGACGLRPHPSGASQVGYARRSLATLAFDPRASPHNAHPQCKGEPSLRLPSTQV